MPEHFLHPLASSTSFKASLKPHIPNVSISQISHASASVAAISTAAIEKVHSKQPTFIRDKIILINQQDPSQSKIYSSFQSPKKQFFTLTFGFIQAVYCEPGSRTETVCLSTVSALNTI